MADGAFVVLTITLFKALDDILKIGIVARVSLA